MRKIILGLFIALAICTSAQAYTIGGAYASLVSVSLGDGGNPSPSGEGKCVVMWSREKVPCWSAHEVRFKGAFGVDSKIQEEGACGSGGDSCARPIAPDSDGARVGDYFWQGCTRPRPHIFGLSAESGYQHDCTMAEGDQFTCTPSGVSVLAQEILGPSFLGEGIFGGEFWKDYG